MIQFNLLPGIKIQYLKAKRQKHIVVMSSVVVTAISLGVLMLLLMTVFIVQKKNVSDLNQDIKENSHHLQGVQDLTKILTVQNQLGALTQLHDDKVVASRLLDYLTQVTPAKASISKLSTDYAENTMTITGSADSLNTVNIYTDTLKFTKYATSDGGQEKHAFSDVVLQTFSRDSSTTTYEIALKFDPTIFNNSEQVALKVPKIITTRSETDKPAEVFQKVEGQ